MFDAAGLSSTRTAFAVLRINAEINTSRWPDRFLNTERFVSTALQAVS